MDGVFESEGVSVVEVGEAKLYGLCEIIVFNIISCIIGLMSGVVLPLGPLLVLLGIAGFLGFGDALVTAGCICMVISLLVMFFYPLIAGGSPYIVSLVKKIDHQLPWNAKTFVVQMAFSPRLHMGFRGLLEDADDIGLLSVIDDTVYFHGDQVTLKLPMESLSEVSTRNLGFRGLWICGNTVRLRSEMLGDYKYVEFTMRSEWNVISAFRRSKELLAEFKV